MGNGAWVTIRSKTSPNTEKGGKMNFFKVWFAGYTNPKKFMDVIISKPAPHWGLYATLIRGLMDGLLLYLPIAIMGRNPPTPSYLSWIAAESYYQTLIWLTLLIFIIQWLLGGAIIHVYLRMTDQSSDIDQILNLTGMSGLVVALILLIWDWLWFFIGGVDQYFLGISHLIIDIWWFVLVVNGISRGSGVSRAHALGACMLSFVSVFPLAIIFMRAPY